MTSSDHQTVEDQRLQAVHSLGNATLVVVAAPETQALQRVLDVVTVLGLSYSNLSVVRELMRQRIVMELMEPSKERLLLAKVTAIVGVHSAVVLPTRA